MFNVNRSTPSNELFSEVNNVINHQLTKTGVKKFFVPRALQIQALPDERQIWVPGVPGEVGVGG